MSAGVGTGRDTAAQDLLARLLTEQEHIAVLRYSQSHNLESDNEVFFLVAMLKVFALAHDQMLHTIAVAEEGRKDIEATVILAEQNLRETFETEIGRLRITIADAGNMMGIHLHQLSAAMGEMKPLRQELERAARDARIAFNAYQRLKDEEGGLTLARMFHDQAQKALDRSVPYLEDTIRTQIVKTVARETRVTSLLIAASFLLQVAFAFYLRR